MSNDLPTSGLPGAPDPDSRPTRSISDAGTSDGPGSRPLSRPRTPDPGPAEKQVGPYTIVSTLGEGGFGVVYLGERTDPITQRVAIKVIKPGMDSGAVMARFELERRSLALMDHPNVARVLDAGSTASGRPYFVMEYVPGEALTAFADRHSLDVRRRLELFSQVCDAVAHAHAKGLIHRDLKPGNIMVEMVDGKPLAKVIDFGIAKAIQHDGLAREAFTLEGMLIGTPEYMSPEQAGGELDIDTRSDIYSLGVILYELLTGALPFDPRELRSRALAEIQRIIREVDPPRPSTRVGETASPTSPVARDRRTQFKTLERTLRSELEWIPLKAMRKERARRYRTAQELRDDIARYLKAEPLIAGPETRAYRARKFVSRNRTGVAAAAAVLVAVIAASAISVRFGILERDARIAETAARAEATAQRDEATRQRDEAATQRDTAESVAGFVTSDLFGAVDPETANPDIRVVDILDRAVPAIDARLADKPAVRARVLRTLGQAYLNIGRPTAAQPLLERALSLSDSIGTLTPDDRDVLVLALNESLWRQRESDAALAILVPAVEARRARLGAAAASDDVLGALLQSVGGAHKWAKRFDEAVPAYAEALGIRTRILGARYDPEMRAPHDRVGPDESGARTAVLSTTYNLVGIEEARARAALFAAYTDKDEPAKAAALEHMREVRDRMRGLAERCAFAIGPVAPLTLAARAEAAYMTNLSGDYESGILQYTELLPLMKQHLTDRHWRTLEASANLADGYRRTNRHAEAAALLAEILEHYRSVRGPTFPDTVSVTDWYANSLEKTGRYAEAAEVLERLFNDLKAANDAPARLKAVALAIARDHQAAGNAEAEKAWRDAAAQF